MSPHEGDDHIISLGSFCVAHKPSHLQVNAVLTIYVRQRPDTQAPTCPSAPTVNSLLAVWICRGAGLRLNLQIDCHECPEYNDLSDDERVDLWAAICQQICNAELWKQLDLVANLHDENFLSPIEGESEKQPVGISIALKHDRNAQATSDRSTRHQLQCPASPADIQPPADIDVVELCKVELRLTVTRYDRWYKKRRKDTTAPRRKRKIADIEGESHISNFDGPFDIKSDSLFTEDSGYFSSQAMQPEPADETLWCSDPADTALAPEQSQQHFMTDDQLFPLYDDGEDLFLPEIEFKTLDECEPEPVADPSQDTAGCFQSDATADAISCLLDAALRLSIHAEPMRLPAGILRRNDEVEGLPYRLSRLIPALFSPGYLAVVAARAVLIPTIAGALKDTLKNASSVSLRAKLTTLFKSTCAVSDGNPTGHEEIIDESQGACEGSDGQSKDQSIESISTHLWRAVMTGCLDAAAARRLKSSRVKPIINQLYANASSVQDTPLVSEYDAVPGSDDSDMFSRAAQLKEDPIYTVPSDPCIFSEDECDEDDIDWLIRDDPDDEYFLRDDEGDIFAFLDEFDAPFDDQDQSQNATAYSGYDAGTVP